VYIFFKHICVYNFTHNNICNIIFIIIFLKNNNCGNGIGSTKKKEKERDKGSNGRQEERTSR
jgi:hypothetical protein